jgi:hypothetical protein
VTADLEVKGRNVALREVTGTPRACRTPEGLS